MKPTTAPFLATIRETKACQVCGQHVTARTVESALDSLKAHVEFAHGELVSLQ